jgi:hypothetical protein
MVNPLGLHYTQFIYHCPTVGHREVYTDVIIFQANGIARLLLGIASLQEIALVETARSVHVKYTIPGKIRTMRVSIKRALSKSHT